MKKRVLFVTLMVAILMCLLALSVGAADVDPNADYYDKVYVSTAGEKMALYEKDGDTYYPLVWFAYDVLDEDGTTVLETKYVSVRFEDVIIYSDVYAQGRFNGVYYEYTDEDGNTIVLNTSNAILINMRGGKITKTMKAGGSIQTVNNITIKTIETTKAGYPSFSKVEAIYFPLTQTSLGSLKYANLKVVDIDKNHTTPITIGTQCLQGSGIREIFIPACVSFGTNGNSQFKSCGSLEKVIFGKGFNKNIPNYCFQGTALKTVYFMGTESELDAITISNTQNAPLINLRANNKISEEAYLALTDDERANGKYLIFDASECLVFGHKFEKDNACVSTCSVCQAKTVEHNEKENLSVSISYTAYDKEGTKLICCNNEGCGAEITDTVPAIFECLGYSTPISDGDSLTIGFTVNNEVLDAYTANTGKTIKFGMFATKYESINGTILDENGNEQNGAIKAEVNIKVTSFDFILTGFVTDAHKTAQLALGAYVIATDAQVEGEEAPKGVISYMQFNAPSEGYSYITYNDALANNQQ